MFLYSENTVTCHFLFFPRIHKKVRIWSLQAVGRWVGLNFSWFRGAGGNLAYTGMCCWTGYGFQGLETRYTILLLNVLNWVSFWTGSLSKSVKTCDKRSTFVIPIIFFLNIYFHDFSVKSYSILYAKQNKSGSESSVSCLKRGSEMNNFCLKQGQNLKASAAHLYPDFPWVLPHPPPPTPLGVDRCCSKKGVLWQV